HPGGKELVNKLKDLKTAGSSKYQNELAEAKTALDAINRRQDVVFFGGSVEKSSGNIHFGTKEGIEMLTELDVFTQEEMIEVKGGNYLDKRKLSDRDFRQFTNQKKIFEGKVKIYLNGNEITPPKKWIYQFTAKEIDERLKDWLLEKGVTEVRTGI
ncbi:MAG: hypothetical protein HC907_30280, partial [Richelia sp. SM1_7_0]|nr:hypothetical protein [Richelia sp. SM1_7_0]